MTTASFRLAAAALVVLALPGWNPVASRCAGQEPATRDPVGDAQLKAERAAALRVLAAETRARLMVFRDPDEAYQLLKRVRDSLRDDPVLSDRCREGLEASLEQALRGVLERGIRVKQQQIEMLAIRLELRARLSVWQCEFRGALVRLGLLPAPE